MSCQHRKVCTKYRKQNPCCNKDFYPNYCGWERELNKLKALKPNVPRVPILHWIAITVMILSMLLIWHTLKKLGMQN